MAVPQQLMTHRGARERVVPVETGVVAPGPMRLAYVDALRALAALAVVFLHVFQIFGDHQALGLQSEQALREPGIRQLGLVYDLVVFRLGAIAVQVFIVISGFSLMLPVARSLDGRQRGGLRTFFARRARRILPPYYAAMALTLLVIAVVPGMNTPADVYWDHALPALDVRTILAHVLLIHNMDGYWDSFSKINPPFWSIAVESQIYLLFPLLLLLWRTWGWLLALLLALAYGVLPLVAPIPTLPLSTSWFVGLFGFGMAAAYIAVGRQRQPSLLRERVPWGPLTALLGAMLIGLLVAQRAAPAELAAILSAKWLEDYALGFAVASLLIFCAGAPVGHRSFLRKLVMWVLEAPALVGIGKFSYSIYLLHAPILALVALAGRNLDLRAPAAYLIVLFWGVPLTLVVSYLFYLVAERPFMSTSTRVPTVAAQLRRR
jgi:peptidoglycan/LPS O-acetylase OafA/YrhL